VKLCDPCLSALNVSVSQQYLGLPTFLPTYLIPFLRYSLSNYNVTFKSGLKITLCHSNGTHSPPSTDQKNTGHFAGHPKGKNRIFYRTSEADFSTFVRHYCILAVLYKQRCWWSPTVGQYLNRHHTTSLFLRTLRRIQTNC